METVSRESCLSSFRDRISHALPSIIFNLKRQRRETRDEPSRVSGEKFSRKEGNPPSRFNLNEVLYEKKVAPLSDNPPLPPPPPSPTGKGVETCVISYYLRSCTVLQKLPQETFVQILKSTFHRILVKKSTTEKKLSSKWFHLRYKLRLPRNQNYGYLCKSDIRDSLAI